MTIVLYLLLAYVLISLVAHPFLERKRQRATDAMLRAHRQRMAEIDSRYPEWKGTEWGRP